MSDSDRARDGSSAFAALYGFAPPRPRPAPSDRQTLSRAYAAALRREESAYEALTASRAQMPQFEDENALDEPLFLRWVQATVAVTDAWDSLHRHTLGDGRDIC